MNNNIMPRFTYKKSDFGKYNILDSKDNGFNIIVLSDVQAIRLCDLLNKLTKKLEYHERVIDKCIRNEKKYTSMITDKDNEITRLNKEKRILKKIIIEEMDGMREI